MTGTEPLFSLSDQLISYRNQTVLQFDRLRICAGEKVALLGRSGSGKSTLLRLLYNQRKNQSALCPQHHGLVPVLSVFHNVYMGQLHRHTALYNLINLIRPLPAELEKVGLLCTELEIDDKLHTSADRLSGGQQQRTALARALIQQADVFVGDEPVSAVDKQQGGRLLSLINERHHTCLTALHDQQMALAHFDRIIGLKAGKICLDAATDELRESDLTELYAL